jgi:hypothetical protein
MFRRDPPASAMETNVGRKNPRWDEEEEDDAAEEGSSERIRVLPKPTRFIYKQTLMGLCKLKVQVYLWAFIFRPEQKVKRQ